MGLPRTPLTHYLCVFHSMSSSLSHLHLIPWGGLPEHYTCHRIEWTGHAKEQIPTVASRATFGQIYANACIHKVLYYYFIKCQRQKTTWLSNWDHIHWIPVRCWSVSVCNNFMEVRRRAAWNLFTWDGFGPVLWRVKSSSSIVLLTNTVHSQDMWYGMGIDVRFIWRESLN